MKCRVFGSTDFILSHDCIWVQGDPLTWTLLKNTGRQRLCRTTYYIINHIYSGWYMLINALMTHVNGGGRWCVCTSLDCRMLRSGIHKVPTMVSQMRPLFHTSTVRPRSRRFISLKRGNNRLMLWGGGQEKCSKIQKQYRKSGAVIQTPHRADEIRKNST